MLYTAEQIKTAFENRELYSTYDFYDMEVEVTPFEERIAGKKGFDIKISGMYECPTFKVESLVGLVELFKELTGCENMDISDEFSRGGCETCDWGSSYGKVYRVW
jgi:hypothetical protein